MRPAPIPRQVSEHYKKGGWRTIVVAAPSGNLLGDGSKPEEASPIDALVGREQDWPCFLTRWVLDPGDLEILQSGGQVELRFYVNQMPVHSMTVVEVQ